MSKKPTIRDVARLSNSSIATVSRVLNNSDYPVSKELKEKIIKVAKEINYEPNIYGRMLKGGSSREIGVIVPSISNPYYSQLVSVVERECVKRNYVPIICSSYNDYNLEKKHLDTLSRKQVDGLIISSIGDVENLLKKLKKEKAKFVLFDQYYLNPEYDSVSFDFYKSGFMAVDFLANRGFKKIAFLTGPMDRMSRKMILKGYKDALDNNCIPFKEDLVIISDTPNTGNVKNYEFENGVILAEMLYEQKELPEAIVAINDITAIGIMNSLKLKGIDIPNDISIIGFDDISFSEMITPPLTTMRQSAYDIGLQATNMLLDRIEGKSIENNNIVIEPELIIRKTVK